MRTSEFRRLMDDEFSSSYAALIIDSHHVANLDDRTPNEAIAQGISLQMVWDSLCEAFDIPPERRLGVDRPIESHPFE